MSKIRIYELAKELGVDNKIVINLAFEIGVPGKLSHSNSLEPDEADQIRRAVIRQAIGSSPESQIVTTRVSRVTGQAATVVESRKGNLIRRRKRDEAEESAHAAPVQPEGEAEVQAAEQPSLEEQPLAEPEPALEAEAHAEPAPQLEAAPAAEAAEAVEPPPDEKKAGGPRVLGRIELPQRKVIVKPTAQKRQTSNAAAAISIADPELEDEEAKKKKKKSKKREISRLELVDYEGRAVRRGPKPGGKGVRRDGSDDRSVELAPAKPQGKRIIKIQSETVLVGELAKLMSLKAGEVIAKLMQLGVMATINHAIDMDTATIVAEELGFGLERTGFNEETVLETKIEDDPTQLQPRSPIVTVMGHVDHGKTSLLDTIRKTTVAAREHGGITQHIGAYHVKLDGGRGITFIDTPGHAAFTTMRARGAQVTDVVVLVVAADDGVMPQTLEAMNHAKAAGVPIVVAVNKMDKPNVNPDKLKKQLAEHGLNPEEWGGDTLYFPISALKGTGIKELLDGILLVVEMKELRANPQRRAAGTVIEARQDKGRGSVATVLVQNGTLKIGDVFVSGAESGRVRSMLNDLGERIEEAGPSMPVEITGLSGVPQSGDDFFVVESDANARQVVQSRAQKLLEQEKRALATGPISLEEFARRANNQSMAELNVILKTDVHGSLEAVKNAIEQLSTDKVRVRVLHAAVGGVNESDIQLAIASRAMVVGFGVRAEPRAESEAENAGIEVRFYRIIYELVDDVRKAMAGLLDPIKKEVRLGRAEVRNTFNIPKIGTIAGCYVTEGMVRRGAMLRLLRDSKVVYEGKMGSLKRFKDDAREVQSGYECGMSIEGYNDIKTGDVMEVFEINEEAATL
ncbi:MAG: translation initiation factor IF-2 [Oligoflexia bacterium]|nr:translation initiation factor IF-2 [Oligoflexia bacterium]